MLLVASKKLKKKKLYRLIDSQCVAMGFFKVIFNLYYVRCLSVVNCYYFVVLCPTHASMT